MFSVWLNITAQLIGFAGIAVNALIYQQKNRESLLKMKLTSDVIWAVHYLMIEAYTATAVACLGVLREFVFMKRKKASSLICFLILALLSAVITWNGCVSLLPSAASVTSVVSFYLGIPCVSRITAFPISICMGIYSALNGSYAGVANEILTVISPVVGLIRSRKIIDEEQIKA
mgnify:FL=1